MPQKKDMPSARPRKSILNRKFELPLTLFWPRTCYALLPWFLGLSLRQPSHQLYRRAINCGPVVLLLPGVQLLSQLLA